MKRLIKGILIFIYNLIPSKRIKKYIRKKVIFSNKLSNIFLYEEKNFIGYNLTNTEIYTRNINYLEKKIIVDLYLSNKYNYEKVYSLLKEINLNFDINIHSKKDINTKQIKKLLYLNKIYFNKEINYDEYSYYVRLDEQSFNSTNKYIINNSIQLLNNNNLTKVTFNDQFIKEEKTTYQKEYERRINIPEKNILLYNTNYKSYQSNNYIINLSKVNKEYLNILKDKKLSNNIFIHKIIDLTYKDSIYFKNDSYNYIKKADFLYLSKDKILKIINHYDVVSFDIFDTLICRKAYNPDDIFYKIEEQTKVKNYIKYRKEAELKAREIYNRDVNIYEIYDQLQKILKLSDKDKNKYLNYEIDIELDLCYPRQEMLEFIKSIKNKKKIILVSDMYLTKSIIEKMLIKCGYKDLYEKFYVSNEYNARKDTGELFDIVSKDYNKIIHIGDNKTSDGNMAINKNIDSLVISTTKSFVKNIKINNYGESIVFGNVLNKELFNSPFITDVNSFKINNLKEFGYTIFGPLFLKYITWINNNTKDEEYLFVSREGHFLIKLFEYYSKLTKTKLINNNYFLTSRRAATVANFNTKKDILALLDIQYKGTLKDLLFYRIGYEYTGKNINIELPDDKEKVIEVVNNNLKEILNNSKKEKDNYIKYISNNIKNWKKKNLCIIDLGYSGTVQYHLSKMLDKKINGKYFVVSSNVKPLKIGCKVESCLNKVNNKENNNNFIYLNSLLLEAFLTAPHGQVRCFDDNGKPIYNDNTISKEDFDLLEDIYLGITNYLKDIYEILNKDINKYSIDNDNITEVYKLFFMIVKDLPEEFYKAFKIENMYCSNNNYNILKKRSK